MNCVFKAKKDKVIEIMAFNALLLIPGIYFKQPLLFLIPVVLVAMEYLSAKNYVKLVMNAKIDISGEGINCDLVYDEIKMKWKDMKHVKLLRESGELLLVLEGQNENKIIPMDIFNENQLWGELQKHVPERLLEQTAIV